MSCCELSLLFSASLSLFLHPPLFCKSCQGDVVYLWAAAVSVLSFGRCSSLAKRPPWCQAALRCLRASINWLREPELGLFASLCSCWEHRSVSSADVWTRGRHLNRWCECISLWARIYFPGCCVCAFSLLTKQETRQSSLQVSQGLQVQNTEMLGMGTVGWRK